MKTLRDGWMEAGCGACLCHRYRIIAELARGTFSQIFRCEDTSEHRMVAVKVLNSNFSAIGRNEANYLRRLKADDSEDAVPSALPRCCSSVSVL